MTGSPLMRRAFERTSWIAGVLTWPAAAAAHPGHGDPARGVIEHHLVEPGHVAGLALAVVAVVVITRWRSASRRTRTR